jgi:hypothetical protein
VYLLLALALPLALPLPLALRKDCTNCFILDE